MYKNNLLSITNKKKSYENYNLLTHTIKLTFINYNFIPYIGKGFFFKPIIKTKTPLG